MLGETNAQGKLDESGIKKLVTSGDISQFYTYSNKTLTILKDFDVVYASVGPSQMNVTTFSVKKGTYTVSSIAARINFSSILTISSSGITINGTLIYTEDFTFTNLSSDPQYRIYA